MIACDSVNHGHSSNSPRDAAEPDRVGELEGFLPIGERLRDTVPHAEHRVIEGAPHNVCYEAATRCNDIVGEFLARVLPAREAAATG